MKNLFFVLLTLALPLFGSAVTFTSSDLQTVVSQDMSSVNMATLYSDSHATFASNLGAVSNFCMSSTSATKIYGSTTSTVCGVGTVNTFFIPANGNICLERVKLHGTICVKSSSGTISSGVLDATFW